LNDYYQDLGVSRDASPEDIKRAYRKKARALHPDVNPSPEAEEQFKKVSQAYDVLSDADKRRSFDMGSDPYAGGAAGFGQGFSFSDIGAARTPSSGSTSTSRTRSSVPRRSWSSRPPWSARPVTVTAPSPAPRAAPVMSVAVAARSSRCNAPSSARS
jgi:DnaJ-class molecular chaperone